MKQIKEIIKNIENDIAEIKKHLSLFDPEINKIKEDIVNIEHNI